MLHKAYQFSAIVISEVKCLLGGLLSVAETNSKAIENIIVHFDISTWFDKLTNQAQWSPAQ